MEFDVFLSVKAYAISALMKIYSFEIAAGRKVDVLPECQSFIEELLASHSTDLQQRAYELQAILGLDANVATNIMPMDASCEDIEIDRSLSFLNGYVQQSLENGAQPYIPESERSGMVDVSSFRSQEQHEVSSHALRFEAYELPKPVVPSRVSPIEHSSSNELVPVPEPSYHAEIQQVTSSVPSVSDSGSLELKLKLDGVQRKWGRPTYSSAAPSTSNADIHKIQNGAPQLDAVSSSSSKAASYDSRRQEVEISAEKQKLAASLFGGTSKSDRRQSSGSQKVPKTDTHAAEKSHVGKNATSDTAVLERTSQPPPDLLDLGESTVSSRAQSVDPFKQLEGLLDQDTSTLTSSDAGASGAPDIMSLYGETTLNVQSSGVPNLLSAGRDEANLLSGLAETPNRNGHGGNTGTNPNQQLSKGPNAKESLEKDALVRQLGVTPTGQNPNLFRDLLG